MQKCGSGRTASASYEKAATTTDSGIRREARATYGCFQVVEAKSGPEGKSQGEVVAVCRDGSCSQMVRGYCGRVDDVSGMENDSRCKQAKAHRACKDIKDIVVRPVL